jgi:prevent-host-death family protein
MIQYANTVTTAEAREKLADLINRTAYAKERTVLTRRGKGIAALVPLEDLEVLEQLEDLIDLQEARAVLEEADNEGTISWEEVKRTLRP